MSTQENKQLSGCSDVKTDARCLNMTDLFFSKELEDVERAKSICEECSMKKECLSNAIKRGEHYGVWGGVNFSNKRQRYSTIREFKSRTSLNVLVG